MRILLVGWENEPTDPRDLALLEQGLENARIEWVHTDYPRNIIREPQNLAHEVGRKFIDAILVRPDLLPATALAVVGNQAKCLLLCQDRSSGRKSLRVMEMGHDRDYQVADDERRWASDNRQFKVMVVGTTETGWVTSEQTELLRRLHPQTGIADFVQLTPEEWEYAVRGGSATTADPEGWREQQKCQPNLVVVQSDFQLLKAFNALLLRRTKEQCQEGLPRRFPHVLFRDGGAKLVEFFLEFKNLAEEE